MHIIAFHAIDKQALFISLDKELLKVQAKLHMYTEQNCTCTLAQEMIITLMIFLSLNVLPNKSGILDKENFTKQFPTIKNV